MRFARSSAPTLRGPFAALAMALIAAAGLGLGHPAAAQEAPADGQQSAPEPEPEARPAPPKPRPKPKPKPKPAAVVPAPAPAPAAQPAAAPSPAAPASDANAAASQTLPRGASLISETYGDWTVECRIVQERKACTLSQAQGDAQTGRRIFAIEFRPTQDGQTPGTILLPFGVNLDPGIKLKLDETDLGRGATFSTCIATGCLVPISFPTVATDAMKKSKRLIVLATKQGQTEPVTFAAPLEGFPQAMARLAELWNG